MKKFVVLFLFFIFPLMVNAYEVNLEWEKKFEGEGYDSIDTIIDDGDGGFVVLGISNLDKYNSYSSQDALIAKFDSEGNIIWKNDFAGSAGDGLRDVVKLKDGNYLVVGSTASSDIEGIDNNGESDAILLKYDNSGKLLWKKSFGGNKGDYFSKIYLLDDGFIVCGSFNSDSFLDLNKVGYYDEVFIKFDFEGNIIWKNSWGKPVLKAGNYSVLYDNKMDSDGNIIAVGNHLSSLNNGDYMYDYDGVVVKYDSKGQLLWEKTYHLNGAEYFDSFILEDDGSVICFGYIEYFDYKTAKDPDGYHGIIVKYDKDGNLVWEKEWISKDSELAEVSTDILVKLNNGNYLAVGYLTDLVCEEDCYTYLVEFDRDGNVVYENRLGNNTTGGGTGKINVFPGNDNGYFVAYSGNFDLINEFGSFILKYDNEGNLLNYHKFSDNKSDIVDSLMYLEDGGLLLNYRYYTSDTGVVGSDYKLYKYSFVYDLEQVSSSNGKFTSNINGNTVVINATPNEGFKVDKIIVKDKNGDVLDVNFSLNDDGTYSFNVFTDVSIEVLFKENIENPKTFDFPEAMICFSFLIICLSGYYYIYSMNKDNLIEF